MAKYQKDRPLHDCANGRCKNCGGGWLAYLDCEGKACAYVIHTDKPPLRKNKLQRDLYAK